MRYIKKDKNGKVKAVSSIKFTEDYELATEDYDVGFDGKIYSVTEMQSEEYQKRKSVFDKEIKNSELSQKYIPNIVTSLSAFAKAYLKQIPLQDTSMKLSVAGLYEEWTLGKYEVGDIRNYAGQTCECHQAHDNAIYPDITPDNPQTWANFWRPLHGTSINTARPWTKPWAGTTDMYHADEYMVYTDEKVYKCLADTTYSPEEYPAHWELQE